MNVSKVTNIILCLKFQIIISVNFSNKRVLKAGKGSICPELSIALDMNVSKVTQYNSMFEILDNYQCKHVE